MRSIANKGSRFYTGCLGGGTGKARDGQDEAQDGQDERQDDQEEAQDGQDEAQIAKIKSHICVYIYKRHICVCICFTSPYDAPSNAVITTCSVFVAPSAARDDDDILGPLSLLCQQRLLPSTNSA